MKKSIFLMTAFICAFIQIIKAQTINKTYYLNNYFQYGISVEEKIDDGFIFFSSRATSLVTPNSTKLLITQTDGAGSFLQSILIDSEYFVHKIKKTSDGLLFAAYDSEYLHVIKFDNMLNNIWSKIIPIGHIPPLAINYPISFKQTGVDILVSHDSTGQEEYYFVNAAPTFNSSYVNNDIAFSVTKLDVNGQLIWHHRYTDNNRNTNPSKRVYDVPKSIISIDSTNTNFVIAGTRWEIDSAAHNSDTLHKFLFFITIDKNAGIVTNYKRVQTADSRPQDPAIVWDYNRGILACTYEEENFILPINTSSEGIGFITLNMSINPLAGRYYYRGCGDKGKSIYLLGDTSYAIGAQVAICDSPVHTNPALLNVDAATLTPLYITQYNIYKDVYNYCQHVEDNYGWQYMITWTPAPNPTPRLLKTDNTFYTCGAQYFMPDTFSFIPNALSFQYTSAYQDSITDLHYTYQMPSINVDDCDTSSNPNYYKTTNVPTYSAGSVAGIAVAVYPSIITEVNATVTCSINANKNADAVIAAYNIMGQCIYKESFSLKAGVNNTTIKPEAWGVGLNMVKVYVNNELANTTKVILTQ
ncbi:MAG: hypothetical protein JST82_13905 [Bacteroidetes bacterium]|nr:hypothetical protein [Bacteroidota bacterium]